jgi:error-prone DNA polymerase
MYAELHCKTNYSFLTAASHPDELVEQAVRHQYRGLAITDLHSLAGVVRGFAALRDMSRNTAPPAAPSLKLIYGAEIIPNDAPPVVLWATDRESYGNLSELITVGRRRAPKGECWLSFADIAQFASGLMAGVIPLLPGDFPRLYFPDPQHPGFEWYRSVSLQPSPSPAIGLFTGSSPADSLARFPASLDAADPFHCQGLAHNYCDYRDLFQDRGQLLASFYLGTDDRWRLQQLQKLARLTGLPLVAAGDVLYHHPSRMPLHDVLTAIKFGSTVQGVERLLPANASRHLKSLERLRQTFALIPESLERNRQVAENCQFCLSQLRYEYPEELAPAGITPFQYLTRLTWEGAAGRYPEGIPARVRQQLEHELKMIDQLRYEAYFLTVWDLVRFARGRQILCQGRGSAANSAVCYCLGVTSVDPATSELLFERFISRERNEAPDIDIDFEHERREEVLQYLYDKYGRERAGLAASVVTYRARSAVREIGKALGLSLDRVDALAKQLDGYSNDQPLSQRMQSIGLDPESSLGSRLLHLSQEILGFPRHLSQHVGGMVMTRDILHRVVPVENASMDGRTVIQWDKDDLETLGILKVDCLSLGMLSAIRKSFELIEQHWQRPLTLATVPAEDPRVYDMICAADTVGVFQIESRGQMSMLPRMKPRCWYDLVIEVAIVRPGPIQGNMVHPYLRRRNGDEPIDYPNEEIKNVLQRTLGVPIFQEQAMKLAVVAAGFTPGQADQLRRAMGKWRKTGIIQKFHQQLIDGMKTRGLSEEFAEQVFRQISGFGEYGFPESHAASFAKLVYVSAWLKYHFPAAFCAALINSQPMGFYAPAQLIADAQKHQVSILPIDVNHSDWDCKLEICQHSHPATQAAPDFSPVEHPAPNLDAMKDAMTPGAIQPGVQSKLQVKGNLGIPPGMRLGMRLIRGLPVATARQIVQARGDQPFRNITEFTRRTGLSQTMVAQLSDADAFGSLQQDRRSALWHALAQEKSPSHRPLFADLEEPDSQSDFLPRLPAMDEVTADYRATGLSLKAHPLSFHRQQLTQLQVTCCGDLGEHPHNRQLRVAGLVLIRQRPSTARGITFVTLEDETGTANLIVKSEIWERFYQIAKISSAWLAWGKLEKKNGVIHLVVSKLEDLSDKLQNLSLKSRDFR